MKFALLCVLTLAVVSARVVEEKRQDCIDHCVPHTNAGCHFGQICTSNGCGHSCHFILPQKRAMCPLAMCNVFCPYGHKVTADGCLMCGCNESPILP